MNPRNTKSQVLDRFFKLAAILSILLLTFASFAQPGRDGSVVINSVNTVVNCYSPVTNDVAAGTSQVTVNNSGGNNCNWQCGELVMLYQTQGAAIDESNTANYGNISAYNNSGLYEFNYVVAYNGNTVIVQNPWVNNYTGNGRVQLIKVPSYTSLTINAGASIVPLAWQDGGAFRKGGVVAVHCTGTITVNGSINATGYGFRPGPTEQQTTAAGAGVVTAYVANNANQGGEKGESIAGWGAEYGAGRYGRGAPANGGGGGNGHNAGGGGGSNANNGNGYNGQGVMCTACPGTAAWLLDPFVIANGNVLTNSSGGGRGGYTYGSVNANALVVGPTNAAWGGDYRDPVGGLGGHPLNISAGSRLFFGGGGGAGDSNNNSNLEGGKGGGMVYVIAPTITGTGTIQANGGDALNQLALNTGVQNDAPSGGGGGGTVIIKGNVATTLSVSAIGGKGGDQAFLATESEGPGGGGGGGFIAYTSGTPTTSVLGGANGISLSGSVTEFVQNGSTSGGSGLIQSIPSTFLVYNVFNLTASSNSPVCQGGTINFTANAGVAGGTWAWTGPNGFSSSAQNPTIPGATPINSGNYLVIYTIPGGCSDSATVSVTVYPNPVITLTPTQITCNGLCNGAVALNFSTTTIAPYNYVWNNGSVTQNLSNICVGNYSVTVTDAHACVATANTTITQPPLLTVNLTPTAVTCNNVCNGSIVVTAGGGTPVYSYSINGGATQAGNTFTGLCDGNYNVTLSDTKGCTISANTTITEPLVLTLNAVSTVAATCGLNNGSLTVNAIGGTVNYTYTLNGVSQPNGTFSNLAPGNYNVSVADANGCTANTLMTISASPIPVISVLANNPVSCFGGANGSIVVGVTGGTAPFTFSLNGGAGQASNLFNNLIAGNYTATVTDANGCTASMLIVCTQPTQMTFTTTVTPLSCNSICDGQVLVNASGGTAPYQYSGDNGATFQMNNPLTNFCSGSFDIVVKDANGCLTNATVNVTQPAPLTANAAVTNPICNGSCDGIVTMTPNGGTAPYTYQLNNLPIQPSNTINNVCAGNQVVTVFDANGCEVDVNVAPVDPAPINVFQVSMTESNCGFNNGALEFDATGPNGPFQFSINGGPQQATGLFSNLFAGAYLCVAENMLGCRDSLYLGINDIEMDGILINSTDPLCFGGSDGTLEVTNVNGQAPITYELDNSGVTQFSGFFGALDAGSHIVTIYDAGFCIFTIPVVLGQPDEIQFTTDVTDVACYGAATGIVDVTNVTGGIGAYQYSFDAGASFSVISTLSNQSIGNFDITVMDDNGCMQFDQVQIVQTLPIVISNNTFDLTCYQNATGFIQLGANGGNGGYQYSIDNGGTFSNNSTFMNLAAGNYAVVIQDQEGCLQDTVVTLNEPSDLTIAGLTTDVFCLNACDGTITGNGGGGTPSYIYSVDGGIIYNANGQFTNMCSGAYTLLVQDMNSCIDSVILTINSPVGLSGTFVTTSSTCSLANGQITLNGAGGSGPYTYSVDGVNFVGSGTFTGLLQGTYNTVIRDANGCEIDSIITLTDLPAPVISFVNTTEPSCYSICNATATVIANGGTGATLYALDGGANQALNSFNALCAGNHQVIITDVNACTDTLNFVIGEPDSLEFTLNGTNLSCNQNASGQISVNVLGGTQPYNYSYDNGVTFTLINNAQFLTAGNYTVIVKDANNCQTSNAINLTEPTALSLNLVLTNPNCFGECNGSAVATALGGTGLYTYEWDGIVNGTNTYSNLCEGQYEVIVEDANGCLLDSIFTLTNPPVFIIDALAKTDALCKNSCDGSITITCPTALQYSIDNGLTFLPTNTFNNLCAGDYLVQAENANGCKANNSITVNEPTQLMLFSNSDSLMCVGDTIPLFAIAIGGTAPYTYTWSNGFIGSNQDVIHQTPASYNVSVVDNNGCSVAAPNVINLTMLPVMGINLVSDTFICAGTQVTLAVNVLSGTAPYTFQWNTAATDTLNTITVMPLVPTDYIVTVHDVCSSIKDTASVHFFAVPTPQFVSNNAAGCSPLTVDFSNDPAINNLVNCSWSFENGPTIAGCGAVQGTFINPGCYDVNFSATTTDGCPVNANFQSVVCVYENPVASFGYNPSQPTAIENTVNFNNTTYGGDTYNWSFGSYGTSTNENPNVTFTGIEPDQSVTVCLVATSDHGCMDSVCKVITFLNDFLVWVPNTFTPDGDEYNNMFNPVFSSDKKISDYSFMIFNRWGELIFESHNPEIGWDGTYHAQYSQDGTYTWVIEVKDDLKGKKHKFVGHVNILR